MRSDFYVYLWKDRLGHVIYVGKGSGLRAYESRVVQGVTLRPADFVIVIVRSGLTELEALRIERETQDSLGVGTNNPHRENEAARKRWLNEYAYQDRRDYFDDAFDEEEISSTDDLEDCQF